MSLDQLVQDVYDAAAAERVAAGEWDNAQATRDRAIRAALAAGAPVPIVVEASGLSRERVYQIKAGRR